MFRSIESGKSKPKCGISHASETLPPLPLVINLLMILTVAVETGRGRILATALETGSLTRLAFHIIFHITLYPSKPQTCEPSCGQGLSEQLTDTHRRPPRMAWDAVRAIWMSHLSPPHCLGLSPPCKAN